MPALGSAEDCPALQDTNSPQFEFIKQLAGQKVRCLPLMTSNQLHLRSPEQGTGLPPRNLLCLQLSI